jgi:hypothetical protein
MVLMLITVQEDLGVCLLIVHFRISLMLCAKLCPAILAYRRWSRAVILGLGVGLGIHIV